MHAENGGDQVAFTSQSQLPCPYGTAAICIFSTGGVKSEGAVSKASPQAVWHPLRLYLWTPDWLWFEAALSAIALAAAHEPREVTKISRDSHN